MVAVLARGTQAVLQKLPLAALQHAAHGFLVLLGVGVRHDLGQPPTAHLRVRHGDRVFHVGVRPHRPQLRVVDRQSPGGLGERPLREGVRERRARILRSGAHQQPLDTAAVGRPAVREHLRCNPAAVPVPQLHPPAPTGPAVGGTPFGVLLVGEQILRRAAHHVVLPVAQKPLGALAPPRDDAAPIDGGRGGVRPTQGALRPVSVCRAASRHPGSSPLDETAARVGPTGGGSPPPGRPGAASTGARRSGTRAGLLRHSTQRMTSLPDQTVGAGPGAPAVRGARSAPPPPPISRHRQAQMHPCPSVTP